MYFLRCKSLQAKLDLILTSPVNWLAFMKLSFIKWVIGPSLVMSLTWTYLVPDLYFSVIILRVYFILLKNVDAHESKIQFKGTDFQFGFYKIIKSMFYRLLLFCLFSFAFLFICLFIYSLHQSKITMVSHAKITKINYNIFAFSP